MSLTRDEWSRIWESIKQIEFYNKKCIQLHGNFLSYRRIDKEVELIKTKIQEVIGQME
jgi:hypothetical protein